MEILPFELNKEISKTLDVNIMRLVNKQLCLANMDRYCDHVIEHLHTKDINYLYAHYKKPFMIYYIYNDNYTIVYSDHRKTYQMYDADNCPNAKKHNKTYKIGAFLFKRELNIVINNKFELDLLSYDYLMMHKGCDKQQRHNKLKDILNKKYQLTKTWAHEEYYSCMIDDHLWFMTNAKVMNLIDYQYDLFIIDYSKFDYDGEEETHPRVLEEKRKIKTEIDMFYQLILSHLKNDYDFIF